jgi:hypothetical protein
MGRDLEETLRHIGGSSQFDVLCYRFTRIEALERYRTMKRLKLLLLCSLLYACGDDCRRIAGIDFDAPPVSLYPTQLPQTVSGFAVFGDTQRTSWQECAIGREVNDAETATLIQAVADAEPSFVVIVGDLVFHGADEDHWHFFDHTATPLREAEIPLLPAVGNHEYWGSNESALEHMRARFSRFATDTWYVERYGALGLVVLDSNHGELDDAAWLRQLEWYTETLTALNTDPEVRGVIVFGHHPPFTNSPIVDGDEEVQSTFLPAFCESPKALAFITGHAHGYEHFIRGVDENCGTRAHHFIITAGGGGPRPDELRSAAETGRVDTYTGGTPRPFNYLWMVPTDEGVSVEARGFQSGETEVRLLESFTLDY